MIGKKIPNPQASSSKAARIGGLLDYMERPETRNHVEKCVYSNSFNFSFESDQGQRAEMISLAMAAPKSKDPVDHYVLSWKEGEQPTREQCEAAKILLDRLGVPDHQCRYALHRDTDNYHLHVVVNRVNPETEKVKQIEYPVNKLHEALALIEHQQGWEREHRGLYMVNAKGEPVRTVDDRTPQAKIGVRANGIETLTGERSAERIAIEEAAPILRQAQSWGELHEQLGQHGIRFETKGSGAILRFGDQPVKASAAGRDCSLSALQKRLGRYQQAQGEVTARTPEPVQVGDQNWTAYAQERRHHFEHKNEAWNQLRTRHQAEREGLKTDHQQQRQDLLGGGSFSRTGLNTARSMVAARQAGERAELTDQQERERQQLRKPLGRFETYEEWLERRDPQQAQQWRYRQAGQEPQQQSIIGHSQDTKLTPRDIRSFVATVDEKNRRVVYRRAGEPSAGFIDRGSVIDVHNWTDPGTTLAALQLAAEKWGDQLEVNGNDEYKALCVKLAAENGWTITNPELQQDFAPWKEQRLAESHRTEKARTAPQEKASADRAIQPKARSNEEIYNRHRDDMRARVPGPVDASRVDWMVANRMRATGHTPQEIADKIQKCAAEQRLEERRDWSNYAQRTVAAVFGERGNREQERVAKYADSWTRLEGRDPSAPTPGRARKRARGGLGR